MQNARTVLELNLDDILPNRFQPRIKFNENAIDELAESIKEHGVIQPIVVRMIGDKYEIIAGERRYKASILAGKDTIPAIVTDLDDKNSAEVALIENVQRQDLTAIEEAVSYKKILDMGYLTQEQLADKLGKNQSTVANKMRLLNLSDDVQEALLDGKISERHARSLLKINNEKLQSDLLKKIIDERLTVRRADEEIDKAIKIEMEQPKIIEELKNVEEPKMEVFELEGAEKSMNGNLNIPNMPIIEEVEEQAIDTPFQNVDPGFVDIDKIESAAQDIFSSKPIADLDSLLKPTESITPVEPLEAAEVNNEVSQEELKPVKTGKFFNFFDEPEEDTASSTPISLEPVQKDSLNFDNYFQPAQDNNQTSVIEPIVEAPTFDFMEEIKPAETPYVANVETTATNMDFVEPIIEAPTFDFMEEIKPAETPYVANVETAETNMDFVEPIVEAPTFDFMEEVKPVETPYVANVETAETNMDFVEPIVEAPTFDFMEEIKPAETPYVANVETTETNMDFVEPIIEAPTFDFMEEIKPAETPYVANVETAETNMDFAEPVIEAPTYDFMEEVKPVETPIIPEPVVEAPAKMPVYDNFALRNQDEIEIKAPSTTATSTYGAADMKTIINTIRTCADTIEKYGFIIDCEELDFESSYQVIFTIEKK